MRNHLKFLVYLVLAIGFSLASAGSYDDFFIAIKRDDPNTINDVVPEPASLTLLGGGLLGLVKAVRRRRRSQ